MFFNNKTHSSVRQRQCSETQNEFLRKGQRLTCSSQPIETEGQYLVKSENKSNLHRQGLSWFWQTKKIFSFMGPWKFTWASHLKLCVWFWKGKDKTWYSRCWPGTLALSLWYGPKKYACPITYNFNALFDTHNRF